MTPEIIKNTGTFHAGASFSTMQKYASVFRIDCALKRTVLDQALAVFQAKGCCSKTEVLEQPHTDASRSPRSDCRNTAKTARRPEN
jgi:hypothetical protein